MCPAAPHLAPAPEQSTPALQHRAPPDRPRARRSDPRAPLPAASSRGAAGSFPPSKTASCSLQAPPPPPVPSGHAASLTPY